MGFLEADHQRTKFRQAQPLRRSTPRSDSDPILPLPVMISTKVNPS
jgi:hypothetical protein